MSVIGDVTICPYCNNENCPIIDTDEIEFEDNGTGHYFIDSYCPECEAYFRIYTHFKYEITEFHVRETGRKSI